MKKALVIFISLSAAIACTQEAPSPFGAVPTPYQLEWQKMETNMFFHFGPNTFTAAEWGDGTESEDIFNPSDLDCRQWISTAKAAGFKGTVITAKHHDGFCLWPNPESAHTVAQSSWRDGQGDVLKELSEACREYDVKFGVYVSPWDRNHPDYGSDKYNTVFVNTLKSIYANYGEIYEQWFDQACGEGPNGKKQVYDWDLFNSTVLDNEPQAIIFRDPGPGCRWVGNERGYAGRTSWSTIEPDSIDYQSPNVFKYLTEGMPGAGSWVPSETDVSIRPGWFWKESQTPMVKSIQKLLTIWYESVGRNSLLLLNVPPDNRGLIDPVDSVRLLEFRAALDEIQSVNYAEGATAVSSNTRGKSFSPANLFDGDYDSYWATKDDVTSATLTIDLAKESTFNRVMLQEYIPLGQRVEKFSIEVPDGDAWETVAEETTIGYKRIVLIPETTASSLRINIESSMACPVLNNIELYMDKILK